MATQPNPTGSLQWFITINGTPTDIGTSSLTPDSGDQNSQAGGTYGPLPPGSYTLTANYSGDSNYASQQGVNLGNFTISAPEGQVTITATLTVNGESLTIAAVVAPVGS